MVPVPIGIGYLGEVLILFAESVHVADPDPVPYLGAYISLPIQ